MSFTLPKKKVQSHNAATILVLNVYWLSVFKKQDLKLPHFKDFFLLVDPIAGALY
jgi:hypothetical protein